jgi:hypothetical protein
VRDLTSVVDVQCGHEQNHGEKSQHEHRVHPGCTVSLFHRDDLAATLIQSLFRRLRIETALAAAWANRRERPGSVGGGQGGGGGTGLLRGSTLSWATLHAGGLISKVGLVNLLIWFQNRGQVWGDAVAKTAIRLIFAEYYRDGNRIEYAGFREGLRWIFVVTDDNRTNRNPVEAGDAIQGIVAHWCTFVLSGAVSMIGIVSDSPSVCGDGQICLPLDGPHATSRTAGAGGARRTTG